MLNSCPKIIGVQSYLGLLNPNSNITHLIDFESVIFTQCLEITPMSSYKSSMNETQTNKLFEALDNYKDECDQLFSNPFIGIMKDVNVLVASNTVDDLIVETYYVVKRQGEVLGPYEVKDPKKRKTLMLYCYKHSKKATCIGDKETEYETVSYTEVRRMRSQPLEDRLNQLAQRSLDTFKHHWEMKCNTFI